MEGTKDENGFVKKYIENISKKSDDNVFIVVWGGMVVDVLSDNPKTTIHVINLDVVENNVSVYGERGD